MTTIGLPLAIWGESYAEFLPRWWEGVTHLERQPDEIVIISDERNFDAVVEMSKGYPAEVYKDKTSQTYADFWNKAVDGLATDWIAFCNVDDKFLPEALNDIEDADANGCNLITDVIQDLDSGALHKSKWNGRLVGTGWTMVGAEPMKRELFLKCKGFPQNQRFADWALAMKMHLVGVSAYDTNTIRIIYDRGATRKTQSSMLQGQEVLSQGYAALRALSKELGY